MGQIISKDAAADDIMNDAQKALTNATARGGRWKELAEARLHGCCALFTATTGQLESARLVHAPNAAQIDVLNKQADKKIGKAYDTVWNEVGRPRSDAALAVIFPEGIGTYTDGDTTEQPERMRILVTLLGSGIHSKLSAATANACISELSLEADALAAAVTAGRQTGAKVKVLSRVRTALARVVHAELNNLKRAYKLEGFSEAEIHGVIPDRPGKTKKAEGKQASAPAIPVNSTP